MNVVKEINKINQRELELGTKASWHDDYKDSAYIFVGGLHRDLTEGDVITIFSQYGEIMDINMPRDKETGKQKGFAFLMYEDQRSTILAVDNLNGAKVLDRTLRVDHVKNYKQAKIKGENGELYEPEEQSFNAKPEIIMDVEEGSESSEESGPDIDPEDPMRDYLIAKWKEEKAKKGKKYKSKRKHKEETPEERQARKERKKARKEKKSAGVKAAEELLASLGGGLPSSDRRRRSPSPRESRSRTPVRDRDGEYRRSRHSPTTRRSISHDRSPARRRSISRDRSPAKRSRSRTPSRRSHSRMSPRHPRSRTPSRPPRSRTPPRQARDDTSRYQSARAKPYDDAKRDVRYDDTGRRRPRYDD
ncbi:hypothetical protein BN946_scf185015.g140 [Trametes cinnabarina]|uniref:RRM domain-containing protein n=1 Tax=Pycnoporus cinnabarinus TaxID=5643 RepID=A0A060SI31_PYCCI|nr:hypothetical protein BN946_scf185015.g140 [Trametes cinnabarina]